MADQVPSASGCNLWGKGSYMMGIPADLTVQIAGMISRNVKHESLFGNPPSRSANGAFLRSGLTYPNYAPLRCSKITNFVSA